MANRLWPAVHRLVQESTLDPFIKERVLRPRRICEDQLDVLRISFRDDARQGVIALAFLFAVDSISGARRRDDFLDMVEALNNLDQEQICSVLHIMEVAPRLRSALISCLARNGHDFD